LAADLERSKDSRKLKFDAQKQSRGGGDWFQAERVSHSRNVGWRSIHDLVIWIRRPQAD
jgi:hypothetical protein